MGLKLNKVQAGETGSCKTAFNAKGKLGRARETERESELQRTGQEKCKHTHIQRWDHGRTEVKQKNGPKLTNCMVEQKKKQEKIAEESTPSYKLL